MLADANLHKKLQADNALRESSQPADKFGVHFDYNDLCNRLLKVQSERNKMTRKVSAPRLPTLNLEPIIQSRAANTDRYKQKQKRFKSKLIIDKIESSRSMTNLQNTKRSSSRVKQLTTREKRRSPSLENGQKLLRNTAEKKILDVYLADSIKNSTVKTRLKGIIKEALRVTHRRRTKSHLS
jgi:hypothetical protein